jgi:3-oxoadipate enol-lactonase
MVQDNGTGSARAESGIETVMLGDIAVAYRRVGHGQPVVFVHGLAEDGGSWDPILRRLPEGVAGHAPDLRGHGATTPGSGTGTAAQLADDLAAFLKQVTGPAICVGFSLGGVVVLEAALRHPNLLRKAIVVGTSSKVGRAAAAFFQDRIAQVQTDLGAFHKGLAADTVAQVVRDHGQVAGVAARRIAAVGRGAGYVNAARAMIAMAAEPMTARLKDIAVPVHIIQGAADAFCPQKAANILREAMPSATYAEIPDAGHLMTVDQPDLLAAEIARAIKI